MNALAREGLDYLLAELAQANSSAAQLRILAYRAEEIAFFGIGIHPHEKIRRRKIEKTQSVRLNELGQIQHTAQLAGGRRNFHGQQHVAGFCGSQQMAHWTDAADPLHQVGHLVERTSDAEFLESPELCDLKIRLGDFAMIVELQRDLGMAFDARNRIDRDRFGHLPFLSQLRVQIKARYAPKRDKAATSGIRPASNSLITA